MSRSPEMVDKLVEAFRKALDGTPNEEAVDIMEMAVRFVESDTEDRSVDESLLDFLGQLSASHDAPSEGDVEPECREPGPELVVCPDCGGHGYLFGDGYVDFCTKCGTDGRVPKEQA